ncbi:M24 family metallopeptidase [Streptomyces sp. NPDC001675]
MSKGEPGNVHQRVGPQQRAALLARAREQQLDGVLVQSWRHDSESRPGRGPSDGDADTAALWLPVAGGPVLVVHPSSGIPGSAQVRGYLPGPEEMTVVHSSDPLGYVPQRVARIAVVREDLHYEPACGHLAPAATDAEPVFSVADVASWSEQAQHVGSAHRLKGLQRAARTGDLALRAAAAAVQEGATDVAIATAGQAAAIAQGADRARCLVGIGHGSALSDAHGALYRAGHVVRLELNLVQEGFASHAQYTVLSVGAAVGDLEVVEVCYEAREALLTRIAPGASVADVVAAGDQVLADFGLLSHKEGTFGHGIGWDISEPPFLVTGSSQAIQAGSVLAVHIGVVGPRGQTALVGGPVLVSPDGSQELVPGACWTRTRSDLAPMGAAGVPLLMSPHVTGFREDSKGAGSFMRNP